MCPTVYHESFKAEKFCDKLYMQTFTIKLSWNPSYFLLNPYMNSAILNFCIKFCRHAKVRKFHSASILCSVMYIVGWHTVQGAVLQRIQILSRNCRYRVIYTQTEWSVYYRVLAPVNVTAYMAGMWIMWFKWTIQMKWLINHVYVWFWLAL